jgi:hypothetical protein
MRTPPTGEPYAGKPPVRFGGRGGESLPYPYQGNIGRPRLLDRRVAKAHLKGASPNAPSLPAMTVLPERDVL